MFFFFKQINFIDRPERLVKIVEGIDAIPVTAVVTSPMIEFISEPKPEVWHKTSGAEKLINRVSKKIFILLLILFQIISDYSVTHI